MEDREEYFVIKDIIKITFIFDTPPSYRIKWKWFLSLDQIGFLALILDIKVVNASINGSKTRYRAQTGLKMASSPWDNITSCNEAIKPITIEPLSPKNIFTFFPKSPVAKKKYTPKITVCMKVSE